MSHSSFTPQKDSIQNRFATSNAYDVKDWLVNILSLLPFLVVSTSLLVLMLQSVYYAARKGQSTAIDVSQDERVTARERPIVWFSCVRWLGCLALISLSAVTVMKWESEWGLLATAIYASVLSGVSMLNSRWSIVTTPHLNMVLLPPFAIYMYRDVWPFITTTETPRDIVQGPILWAKIAVLTLVAVVIPIFIPCRYIPVDPSDPMEEPSPDLTASIFAKYLYFYLDSVIFKAAKVEHLSLDDLPPLSDRDRSRYLKRKAFTHLDPSSVAKNRHLFFKLLRVFRKEYFVISLNIIIQVIVNFGAPIGINRILSYLEYGPGSSNIRPWFWVIWILLGPMSFSIARQSYIFMNSRIIVRVDILVTQLVFEHSLRIRVKAETSGSELAADTNTSSSSMSPESQAARGVAKKEVERKDNLIGKLNNLVTTDMHNLYAAKDFLLVVFYVPLQIAAGIYFLYNVLGLSALAGILAMVVLIPVQQLIMKKVSAVSEEKMKLTDARVQSVTETVSVLRMVKMFAWESKMNEAISQKRKDELRLLFKSRVLETLSGIFNHTVISLVMLTTYGFHTIVMNKQLSAAIVYSSMPMFDLMNSQLWMLTTHLSMIIRGKVSLNRINEFLNDTELLDEYTTGHQQPRRDSDVIGFKDCSFAWSNEDGTTTPSFRLRIKGELSFKEGCINLITGLTGAGKTSMLMALLGEMHFISTGADAWVNLPRNGGVAYASQESWVLNDTIRNNVLFGSVYDENRYEKVLQQCALKHDLELFDAGDETEVGERGITLRRELRSREPSIRLRKYYFSTTFWRHLMLIHNSKWIVEECLLGELFKGRTVLLVTHNIPLTTPIAHFVVSIGLDGQISTASLTPRSHIPTYLQQDTEEIIENIVPEKSEETKKDPKGKLIVAEEVVKGRVGWKAIKLFVSSLGGNHPIVFFTMWIFFHIIIELMHSGILWYVGYWGSRYDEEPNVQSSFYLGLYALLVIESSFMAAGLSMYYAFGTMRASQLINNVLMRSILHSTFRWLDETPVSRIITRCTQDMGTVDNFIGPVWGAVVELALAVLVKLICVAIVTPVFIVPGLLTALLGVYVSSVYQKAQLPVRREKSNVKAPVLAHFGATVSGLVSVRAFGAQESFKGELQTRIDNHSRAARMSFDLNRWLTLRTDFTGALFTASLALYLVLSRKASAAITGFALALALDFCYITLTLVELYNEFEAQANSLERIQGYLEIDHEKTSNEEGKPPASWPMSGDLRVENLSARYSVNSPEVLHNLSFEVRSGQRIGVVGRTGSGKSTLTLALLRCILTEGYVYYDGVSTDKLNLDALRSNITIIPQAPELLSGTLRRNLDPFGEHDDADLNAALKYAGLFSLQNESDNEGVTLDTKIAGGGGNLSVGQRQIVALARAMVRESKLLILDEATSSIDYKTDVLIQDALRTKLGADVTVITIAHRLQTIMDADKIMVLDAGSLVEFDTPKALLLKEDGIFKGLVNNSSDSATLQEIAFSKEYNR